MLPLRGLSPSTPHLGGTLGTHLRIPDPEAENLAKDIVRFSKTQKWAPLIFLGLSVQGLILVKRLVPRRRISALRARMSEKPLTLDNGRKMGR